MVVENDLIETVISVFLLVQQISWGGACVKHVYL